MAGSSAGAADSDPANRAGVSQRVAELAVGPLVLASMLPAFLLLARWLGKRRGWYAGLALYWVTWCAAVPLMLAGRDGVKEMFRPSRRDPVAAMLAVLPPLVSTLGGAAVGGAGPRRESVALVCTAFGNGLAEEVLWRGLFAARHRENLWKSVIWPSVWFGAWHLAPGITAADGRRVPRLVAGAFVLGLAYGNGRAPHRVDPLDGRVAHARGSWSRCVGTAAAPLVTAETDCAVRAPVSDRQQRSRGLTAVLAVRPEG